MADSFYTPAHPKLERTNKAWWGPAMWRQLHDRPEQTGGNLAYEHIWIEGFRAAIPCGDCRQHFTRYLSDFPLDLRSTHHYFAWTWSAHNAVRARRGQRMLPWQNSWGAKP